MIQYRLITFILLFVGVAFILVPSANAQCFGHSPYEAGGCPNGPQLGRGAPECIPLYAFNACVPALGAFGHTLNVAIPWIFWLVGAIGLFVFIKGAYQYMGARSDPEKIENAKLAMTSAVVGVMIIILSFTILEALDTFLDIPGWNIDLFNIPI